MTDKILLNTGPSPRGWHRLESMLRCPQLYAFIYELNLRLVTMPLVRGSLAHVGLAHYYARLQAQQQGKDPEAYYPVDEAIDLVAPTLGPLGPELAPLVKGLLRDYARAYRAEKLTVVAVEQVYEAEVGGYRFTMRFDLVVREKATGRIWVWDHKCCSRLGPGLVTRYTLSGQFLGMVHMSQLQFGSAFAGVRINLLQPPAKAGGSSAFDRISPDPAPDSLAQFPQTLVDAEEDIARWKASGRPPTKWRRANSEQTCITPYGPCAAYSLCQWGKVEKPSMPNLSFIVEDE